MTPMLEMFSNHFRERFRSRDELNKDSNLRTSCFLFPQISREVLKYDKEEEAKTDLGVV